MKDMKGNLTNIVGGDAEFRTPLVVWLEACSRMAKGYELSNPPFMEEERWKRERRHA